MDNLKIKKENDRIEYSISKSITKILSISYDDIKNIENIILDNDETKRDNFKITIETKSGEYSYKNANEISFEALINEHIKNIYFRLHIYSKSTYITLSFYPNSYPSIKVESLNEIYTRGICEKIVNYLSKNETWYSGLLKILLRYEWLLLSLLLFGYHIIKCFNQNTSQYKCLFCLYIIIAILLIFTALSKLCLPKTKFIVKIIKSNPLHYFNNPQFWQHVVNTIITIIFTTIVNCFVFKP